MVMRLTNGKVKDFKTEHERYLKLQGNNNKVRFLIKKTGESYKTVRGYLRANGWDLFKAWNDWSKHKYCKKAKKV